MKMRVLLVVLCVCLAPVAQAAQLLFEGTILQTDLNNDGFDDLSIDTGTFTVSTAGTVSLDATVDGFWGYLLVLDENNQFLADETNEPFLSIQLDLDPGEYTFAIGTTGFSEQEALDGLIDGFTFADFAFGDFDPTITEGDWALAINTPLTEVPLPAALPLFLSSLLGLGLWRRRSC